MATYIRREESTNVYTLSHEQVQDQSKIKCRIEIYYIPAVFSTSTSESPQRYNIYKNITSLGLEKCDYKSVTKYQKQNRRSSHLNRGLKRELNLHKCPRSLPLLLLSLFMACTPPNCLSNPDPGDPRLFQRLRHILALNLDIQARVVRTTHEFSEAGSVSNGKQNKIE